MNPLTTLLLDPVLGHTAAATLGALLILGGVSKLREQEVFRDALANYELLPQSLIGLTARALPMGELLAGVLLLPVATRSIGAVLAVALLALVTAAIAINLARGRRQIDCGCGGASHTPLSGGLIARNAVLVLLAVAAALPMQAREVVWLDYVAIAFATHFLLGLYLSANQLLSNHPRLIELRTLP